MNDKDRKEFVQKVGDTLREGGQIKLVDWYFLLTVTDVTHSNGDDKVYLSNLEYVKRRMAEGKSKCVANLYDQTEKTAPVVPKRGEIDHILKATVNFSSIDSIKQSFVKKDTQQRNEKQTKSKRDSLFDKEVKKEEEKNVDDEINRSVKQMKRFARSFNETISEDARVAK